MEQDLDLAFFSPDLTVWKTALNSKYLITGQLGVNPELVELENNFPRFNLLIGEDESDISILKRVINKDKELKKATEGQHDKLNVAKETDAVVKSVFSHTDAWSKREEETETNDAKEIDDPWFTLFTPRWFILNTNCVLS